MSQRMQITCVIKSFNVSKPFISRESQYMISDNYKYFSSHQVSLREVGF